MYLLASFNELQTIEQCTSIIFLAWETMDLKVLKKIHMLQVQSEVRKFDALKKERNNGQ